MNGATIPVRLLVPRPGATFGRLVLSTLLPAVVLAVILAKRPVPGLVLFMVQFLVAQAAIALTLGHKEVLAAHFTFVQPGLRPALARLQAAQAVAVALGAVVAMRAVGVGAPALASVLGLSLAVYALLALATLELFWSYQLPAFLYYAFFLITAVDRAARAGRIDALMQAWWLLLPAGVALLALVVRRMRGADLHRRLSGTLVLGSEDIFRPGRQQDLKRQRARHGRGGGAMRWRQALLAACLDRAAATRRASRPARARAWLLAHAGLAQGITPRGGKFALILLIILAMMAVGGYVDGYPRDTHLRHWFAGLVFSWTSLPVMGVSLAMNSLPRAGISRAAGLRAEALALAGATVATAAVALLMAGAYRVLAAALPEVAWRGCLVSFLAPPLHGVVSVALLGPALWLAVALRPRHGSTVPSLAMFQVFLLGQLLMMVLPAGVGAAAYAGAMALLGAAAYLKRRRWWRRADLGV